MSDLSQQNVPTPEGQEEQKTFSADYVKELREEAKQHRIQAKQLQSQLEEIQKNLKLQEEAKLQENQQYETLFKQRDEQLQQTLKELEDLKPKAEGYLKLQEEIRQTELQKIPENLREDFQSASLDEIKRAVKLLPTQSTAQTSLKAPVIQKDPSAIPLETANSTQKAQFLLAQNPQGFKDLIKSMIKR